jgi:hypothetical protein
MQHYLRDALQESTTSLEKHLDADAQEHLLDVIAHLI